MNPIFTPLTPEEIAALSDDELEARLGEIKALAEKVANGDADVVGDRDDAAIIAELNAGADLLDALKAEQTVRVEQDAQHKDALAQLRKRITGEEPSAEADPPEGDEPAGEPEATPAEAEPVVAGGAPRKRRAIPRATGTEHEPPSREPAEPEGERVTITASAVDARGGFTAGKQLTAREIAEAMVTRKEGFGQRILENRGEKIPVVRLDSDYGDKRRLDGNSSENAQKMRDVMGQEAILASGGICAPVTPYYGLLELSVPARPVRDALPRFNADRGGIRYAVPPSLADVTDAVGLITAANDARGGTFSQKSCQHVDCPAIAEVDVSIIYHCVEFGNLQARTFPEQVAQFNELVLAAHARVAEVNLLDGISGASTQVTAAQVAGATSTLLGQMITAAAGYRSRNRMGEDAPLRILAPSWIVDAMTVDVLRSQFMRFDGDAALFEAQLRKRNITISWYLDSPTDASPQQVFAAQGDGAIVGYPSAADWFLFAEGSFMFLDGGTLELGIVRDSVLNSTNDFQIFGESFENVAYLGIESLEVLSTFCANGAVTAPVTVGGCPV